MAQSQSKTKVYLDNDGNVIKPEPEVTGTLDTAPSLKTKTYLNDMGEPISDNNTEIPEITSGRGGIPEADTFGKGFMRSILGGDALEAGMSGAKGFVKGATLDIPESIVGAVKGAYGAVTDPIGTLKSIPPAMREMYELTTQAGARPEEFGRMMGNVAGQPLTTAGLIKGIKPTIRGMGAVAEPAGRIMRQYAPITATPIVGPMAGRGLQRLERMTGKGIETVGKKMRNVGRSVPENEPNIPLAEQVLGDEIELTNSAGRPLNKSNRPNISEQITNEPITKDSQFFTKNRPQNVEGTFPFKDNPDIMMLNDGSYVNLKTGETMTPVLNDVKPPKQQKLPLKKIN